MGKDNCKYCYLFFLLSFILVMLFVFNLDCITHSTPVAKFFTGPESCEKSSLSIIGQQLYTDEQVFDASIVYTPYEKRSITYNYRLFSVDADDNFILMSSNSGDMITSDRFEFQASSLYMIGGLDLDDA